MITATNSPMIAAMTNPITVSQVVTQVFCAR